MTATTAVTTTKGGGPVEQGEPVVSFTDVSKSFGLGLALLGGLWVPIYNFPHWVQTLAGYLPGRPYAALGRSIELGDAPHAEDVAVLVCYLLLFAGTAAWLYRKDTRKA